MNKEQAINYLKSSGFSEEQVNSVVSAIEGKGSNTNSIRIIKRGEIPMIQKRFICRYCGTLFDADKRAYRSAGQMAYLEGLNYCCKCPVCGNDTYI